MVHVVQFLLFYCQHKLHVVVFGLVVLLLVVVDQNNAMITTTNLIVVKSLDQIHSEKQQHCSTQRLKSPD